MLVRCVAAAGAEEVTKGARMGCGTSHDSGWSAEPTVDMTRGDGSEEEGKEDQTLPWGWRPDEPLAVDEGGYNLQFNWYKRTSSGPVGSPHSYSVPVAAYLEAHTTASERKSLKRAGRGTANAALLVRMSEMEKDLSRPFMLFSPKFPMYVARVQELIDVLATELPPHEVMLEKNLLRKVSRVGHGRPGLYHVDGEGGKLFGCPNLLTISHQWLQPSSDPKLAHPDDADGTKRKALRQFLLEHMDYTRGGKHHTRREQCFVWMDFFSIPQDPASRSEQVLAIESIPTYFMASGKTLIVCRNQQALLDQSSGYMSRGFCLLELATVKLPR
eukprot:COSAG05_NODE_550_length_8736_cov_153.546254_2_plen_329_part_00